MSAACTRQRKRYRKKGTPHEHTNLDRWENQGVTVVHPLDTRGTCPPLGGHCEPSVPLGEWKVLAVSTVATTIGEVGRRVSNAATDNHTQPLTTSWVGAYTDNHSLVRHTGESNHATEGGGAVSAKTANDTAPSPTVDLPPTPAIVDLPPTTSDPHDPGWTPYRIKWLRQTRRWSQRQLAKACATTQPLVSMWERGQVRPNTTSSLILDNLARGLVLPPDRPIAQPLRRPGKRSPIEIAEAEQEMLRFLKRSGPLAP